MAQLKEIKSRLTVKSTQKITTAMMMVASAKLRKTQNIIQNLYPYVEKLSQLLNMFLGQEENFTTPFTKERPVKRVAIIAFSSNTGLAGRFNDNIATRLESVVTSYLPSLGEENILIYTYGTKVAKAAAKKGMKVTADYSDENVNQRYEFAQQVAGELMEQFISGKIDRVELIYHHFKSRGTQIVMYEPFLPIELKGGVQSNLKEMVNKSDNKHFEIDYIIEPDRLTIIEKLIPKVLKMKFFTTHIDSVTSEHAARMTAMQIANDNADNLIEELTREYNKLRQESITNELLDIVGGTLGKY